MNVNNMLELANFLESIPSPEMFNMSYWVSSIDYRDSELGNPIVHYTGLDPEDVYIGFDMIEECGTAGCIAGWACIYNARNNPYSPEVDHGYFHGYVSFEGYAAEFLGLNPAEASWLFYTNSWHVGDNNVWMKYASEFENSFINDENQITAELITNKDAAYMLRGLALGKFNFEGLSDQTESELNLYND